MKTKITIKTQLRYLTDGFLIILVNILFFLYDFSLARKLGFLLLFLTLVIPFPIFLIHIQYLIKNSGVRLIPINIDSFHYIKNGYKKTIRTEDVLKAEKIICSTSHEFYNMTANYFYHQITLQNGEKIIITCLLAEKLPIEVSEITIKKRFYPFIIN
jgi:hypothetical protein